MGIKAIYLAVFPVISVLAFNCILLNSQKNGVSAKVAEISAPHKVTYTGLPPVDAFLCELVTVFHVAMEPGTPFQFTLYFLGSCAPIMAFIYPIEAYRKDSSLLIGYPTIFAILYQTVTFGIVNPTYCLLFLFSGAASNFQRTRSHISQAHAEAILFGVVIGGLVPTACLFAFKDTYVTAIWQFFPVISMVARDAHLLVRSPKKYTQDGFPLVQFSLISCFIVSSSLHAAIIYPRFKQPEQLLELLVPSPYPFGAGASLEAAIVNLLQWDLICGIGSAVLLTLWFAQSTKQFFGLLLYVLVALPLTGPGATIAGAYLWRESQLKPLPVKKEE